MSKDLLSKFRGVLLASSLGDAIGELAFKFRKKDELIGAIKRKKMFIYTDDTAMAIALAEYLLENEDINPEDLGKKFLLAYQKEPWRGYGPGPPRIFSLTKRGLSFKEAATSIYPGGSFGNGAAMRVMPAALYFWDNRDLYEKIKLVSSPTHTHPLAIDGASVLAKAISFLLKRDKFILQDFFKNLKDIAKTSQFRKKLEVTEDLLTKNSSYYKAKQILKNNSTSLGSVPFSLFCFLKNKENFAQGLIDSVSIAGDRDTIGCMAAGLWGAYLGIEGIPREWLSRLENRGYIQRLADSLYDKKFKSDRQKRYK